MNMKITTTPLLLLTLILFACSPNTVTPESLLSQNPTNTPPLQTGDDPIINIPTVNAPGGPKIIVTVGTPHIDQGPNGEFPVTQPSSSGNCAFSWANSPLEELTDAFETAIKELNPVASARAVAFGEDCVYQDGSKKFLAIETDFYIDLHVTDLTDYEAFGNWVGQTMPVVNSLPADMIEGPQSGFVEYSFTKSQNEHLIVRVPIQAYEETANGKTGEELFRMFYME
jgi:hypothetical protein